MARFLINGRTTINICAEIEAENLEEALEIAEDNISLESYIGGAIGINIGDEDLIDDYNMSDNEWIEWREEWCEEV